MGSQAGKVGELNQESACLLEAPLSNLRQTVPVGPGWGSVETAGLEVVLRCTTEGPAQRLGLPTPVCWWLQLRALERLQGAAPQGGPDRAPEALRHTPPETPAPEGASSPSVRRLYLA